MAGRDLEALTQWPNYCQFPFLDLSLGHVVRILWTAAKKWDWLSPALAEQVRGALGRIMADYFPVHVNKFGENLALDEILARPDAFRTIHNIAFIGSAALALAAEITDETTKKRLDGDLSQLLRALLKLRESGVSEGVSYDGYVLDFLADWFSTLPVEERENWLQRPDWATFFDQSLHLAAPGALVQVAPLGDIEPEQMTFPFSAQAKMQRLQDQRPETATRQWFLEHLDLSTVRADGLAALFEQAENSAQAPEIAPANAFQAVTLRNGWENSDVAVVVAASNTPFSHLPPNFGSVCIGTAGRWMLQTPGYQQYIPNSERAFTLGPSSRNTPVINEQPTTEKLGKIVQTRQTDAFQEAILDLTACYPEAAGASSCRRRVVLALESGAILIEDTIEAASLETVRYHWHGDPAAAWWVEDNGALLHLGAQTLRFGSPQATLEFPNVQRLRGSRGQLTLVTDVVPSANGTVQWLFAWGEAAPDWNAISVLGR